MRKLYKLYTHRESDRWSKIWNLLLAFLVNVSIVYFVDRFFSFLMPGDQKLESVFIGGSYVIEPMMNFAYQSALGPEVSYFLVMFFFGCILAPIWEEYVFRKFVFDIFIRHGNEEHKKRYMLHAIVFSSILFGLAHGSVANLLMQGVGGLILWYVFIQGGKYGYWWSVISHSLWNTSIILGITFPQIIPF